MKSATRTYMSRITERGQVTLPRRLRLSPSMRGARAVEFIESSAGLLVRPVRVAPAVDEQTELFAASMGGWMHEAHDDLFDFTHTV